QIAKRVVVLEPGQAPERRQPRGIGWRAGVVVRGVRLGVLRRARVVGRTVERAAAARHRVGPDGHRARSARARGCQGRTNNDAGTHSWLKWPRTIVSVRPTGVTPRGT